MVVRGQIPYSVEDQKAEIDPTFRTFHAFKGLVAAFLPVSLRCATVYPGLRRLTCDSAYIISFNEGGSRGDVPAVNSFGPSGTSTPVDPTGGDGTPRAGSPVSKI